jgi:hypothetical protein
VQPPTVSNDVKSESPRCLLALVGSLDVLILEIQYLFAVQAKKAVADGCIANFSEACW